MSFSIGPVLGKRDAVIKAVQETKTGGDESQLSAVKAFIVSELQHMHPDQNVQVSSYGHHYGGPGATPTRQVVLSINYGYVTLAGEMPKIVE